MLQIEKKNTNNAYISAKGLFAPLYHGLSFDAYLGLEFDIYC